ncbi:hypothetical protein CEXT_118841 [Caerostris extrusa]|uniref:Uncharacterized protein n=1 Tax=Caerostris extrusa TaxID=172846 RepID=A0AAV4RSM1_CAEEX|nr:hypothetical protein CEXT_118841 [Caerostris extrusa]
MFRYVCSGLTVCVFHQLDNPLCMPTVTNIKTMRSSSHFLASPETSRKTLRSLPGETLPKKISKSLLIQQEKLKDYINNWNPFGFYHMFRYGCSGLTVGVFHQLNNPLCMPTVTNMKTMWSSSTSSRLQKRLERH